MGKVLVLLTAALLSGCATIVEGTDQKINVQLSPDRATCQISQKGSIIATVGNGGDLVSIPKSRNDLLFSCSADGYQKQNLTIESSASGWGVLGCFLIDLCITDYSTGALNKYPKSIKIALQRIGQNVEPGQEQAAPAAVAAPSLRSKWRTLSNRTPAIPNIAYNSKAFYMSSDVPLTLVRQGKVLNLYQYRLPDGSRREAWVRKEHVRPE